MLNSEVAWSKPGWRLRIVKASAQLRVELWVVVCSVVFFVVGETRSRFMGLVAASDLQKSVLVELERHCVQVPGPLMQEFEVSGLVVAISGGVGKVDAGVLSARSGRSLANSAQRQVVLSEQKPQGSGSAVATMEDEFETEVVRVVGRRVENWDVKSISKLVSGFDSCRRLLSVWAWGECGRLNVGASGSAATLSIVNASSMHWHLVSALQLPHPMVLSSVTVVPS